MAAPIPLTVFQRRNTVALAAWLLGKTLVCQRTDGACSRHFIVETEAYHSENDLACHASKGRTARTEVLYQLGGRWYVYLCYGVHEMLNLVAGPEDFPAAVLIRGLHDVSGPGRLTKVLEIDRRFNGKLAEPASGLWLENEGLKIPRSWIRATPRIGVDYAGVVWSAKLWRFTLDPERLKAAISENSPTLAPR